MDVGLKEIIVAIITTDKSIVSSGTAPIFYADTEAQKEKLALTVAKVTGSMVHDLENGSYVVVKH